MKPAVTKRVSPHVIAQHRKKSLVAPPARHPRKLSVVSHRIVRDPRPAAQQRGTAPWNAELRPADRGPSWGRPLPLYCSNVPARCQLASHGRAPQQLRRAVFVGREGGGLLETKEEEEEEDDEDDVANFVTTHLQGERSHR